MAIPTEGSSKRQTNPRIFWWVLGGILLAAVAGMVGRQPARTSLLTPPSPASPTPQTHIALPSVLPPKFRIYKYKSDGITPTSVVVAANTTDEQLRSLVWFFREKVRSQEFKSIGVKNEGAGVLAIYRGETCANENYVSTAGPCGYGDHDDALYQWGIGGDSNKDLGSIRLNGKEVPVFNYKDGWQIAPELQAQFDQKARVEELQREVFGRQLQERLTSMGYEINVRVHEEGSDQSRELNLESEMFKDTATRVQFINSVLPAWKKDLCKVGFWQVNLRQGGVFELGQDYSLGCAN